MDFLTEEFATEQKLTPEQLTAVKTAGEAFLSEERKKFEEDSRSNADKLANRILDGVVAPVEKTTGLTREKGEKVADFLTRSAGIFLESEKTKLQTTIDEYNEKLKNFDGSAASKEELSKMKEEVDRLKKIEADYEPLKGIKEKYEQTTQELSALKRNTAFNNVKPAFPTTVNAYEAKAKWDEFVKGVEEKYTIELIDGQPMAIDKENEHKRHSLADLVAQDKTISELAKGRQQSGSGTREENNVQIEGVPFRVPENATSEQRSQAIKDYLTREKKLSVTSPEYSAQFGELMRKILKGSGQ